MELPDRFDIHEWSIMERFSQAQNIERIPSGLLNAIHGAGAFRAFRGAIRGLGWNKVGIGFERNSGRHRT
jgi:hypothetical protein